MRRDVKASLATCQEDGHGDHRLGLDWELKRVRDDECAVGYRE